MTTLQAALEEIDRLTRIEMDRSAAPGLSMVITDRERPIHVATYGYAVLESREAQSASLTGCTGPSSLRPGTASTGQPGQAWTVGKVAVG